jgi:hypothetical protein
MSLLHLKNNEQVAKKIYEKLLKYVFQTWHKFKNQKN